MTTSAKTEKALEEAFLRLQRNEPRDAVLAEQALLGKLRISILSVAMEAGVSRTLIGYENCDYPLVREKVLAYILSQASGTPGETTRARIRRLTVENSELRDDLALRDLIRASEVVERTMASSGLGPDGRAIKPLPPGERRSVLRVVPKPKSPKQ